MNRFKVVSEFEPTGGDQPPQAIEKLSESIVDGKKCQTLLGVTGSGKTYTVAKVIEKVQKPTLVIAHNKTLAAQLCSEFREFFPENAVSILFHTTTTISQKLMLYIQTRLLKKILLLMKRLINCVTLQRLHYTKEKM